MEQEKPVPAESWSSAYHKARHRARSQPQLDEQSWQYFEVKGEFAYITATGAFRPMDESENEMLKSIYDELDREEAGLAHQVEQLQLALNRERKFRLRLQTLFLEGADEAYKMTEEQID